MAFRARAGATSILIGFFLFLVSNEGVRPSVTAVAQTKQEDQQIRTLTAKADTWVDQGNPGTAHSSDERLIAAFSGADGTRILARFDTAVLGGAEILEGRLDMNLLGGSGVEDLQMAVSGVTAEWGPEVTWENQPPRTKTYSIQRVGLDARVVSWDVTTLLAETAGAGQALHGVAVSGPMGPPDYRREFASEDAGGGPVLHVTYIPAVSPLPEDAIDDGPPGSSLVRWGVAGIILGIVLFVASWLLIRRRSAPG